MSERVKKCLRDEIMNLHYPVLANPVNKLEAYRIGYRGAVHDAAELAAEHEAIESALVEALEMIVKSNNEALDGGFISHEQAVIIDKALAIAYGETQ